MLIILAFFDEYTCSSAVLILIIIMIEYNQEVFVYRERYRLTVLSTSIYYTVLGIQLSCNVLIFAFRF